jgi:glutathione synthase/RimK-type ligase-like ATP-grasp enzyme
VSAAPRYVVLANPDSLRWQAYHPELFAFWRERGIEPDVEVVPWREVVTRDGNLDGLSAFDRPAIVRLESPGRDWPVARMLLQAGCRALDVKDNYLDLEYQKGRLIRPGLFYAGFRRVLEGLRRSFDDRPNLHLCACPLDVAEMFDKNATSVRLSRAGIPVPASLAAPATPADLLDELHRRRWPTTYVKLNTGSSASAIAVVRALEKPVSAISSIVRLRGEFWSSRRLARHTGADLEAVLTFLLREGVCVQQGIRMAQIDGQNFDVRVVVIHGQPAFTIFRLSPHPMTNLHLGGSRGDVQRCRAAIPARAWLDGIDHCVEAARLYRSATVGVDLLFESGYMRHYVLEVNAFGDFFPNWTDEQGRSVHRVEIEATAVDVARRNGNEPRTK